MWGEAAGVTGLEATIKRIHDPHRELTAVHVTDHYPAAGGEHSCHFGDRALGVRIVVKRGRAKHRAELAACKRKTLAVSDLKLDAFDPGSQLARLLDHRRRQIDTYRSHDCRRRDANGYTGTAADIQQAIVLSQVENLESLFLRAVNSSPAARSLISGRVAIEVLAAGLLADVRLVATLHDRHCNRARKSTGRERCVSTHSVGGLALPARNRARNCQSGDLAFLVAVARR